MGVIVRYYKGPYQPTSIINAMSQRGTLGCLILCISTCLYMFAGTMGVEMQQAFCDHETRVMTTLTTEHVEVARDEVMIGSTLFHGWHLFLLIQYGM